MHLHILRVLLGSLLGLSLSSADAFAEAKLLLVTSESAPEGFMDAAYRTDGGWEVRAMGTLVTAWAGLCWKDSGEACNRAVPFRDFMLNSTRRRSARSRLPQEMEDQFTSPDFPDNGFISATAVQTEAGWTLSSSALLSGFPAGQGSFEATVLGSISPANEIVNRSDRRILTDVNPFLQSRANAVVRIMFETVEALGGISGGHGTGFWISSTGILMTNHHVLEGNPACQRDRQCSLTLEQEGPQGSRTETVPVRVLTCTKRDDFCLIQVRTDQNPLSITPLQLSTDSIPESLMSLGFPGDRCEDSSDEDPGSARCRLTYSFGKTIGFSGRGVTSTVYGAGGASGSPVLAADTGRVVGLISNGVEMDYTEDGFPMIFRPMPLLDHVYGIQDYVTGEKQKRIESLIADLSREQRIETARALLASFVKEKTFYGDAKLKTLMRNHPSSRIRKEIHKALQQLERLP